MIRHIVFFTATPERLDEVRAGLSMLTENPHASLLEIGTNVKTDQWDREVDLIVYGEFEDEAALSAYKAHPIYQKATETVKPLREMRMAADYDAGAAVKVRIG